MLVGRETAAARGSSTDAQAEVTLTMEGGIGSTLNLKGVLFYAALRAHVYDSSIGAIKHKANGLKRCHWGIYARRQQAEANAHAMGGPPHPPKSKAASTRKRKQARRVNMRLSPA